MKFNILEIAFKKRNYIYLSQNIFMYTEYGKKYLCRCYMCYGFS